MKHEKNWDDFRTNLKKHVGIFTRMHMSLPKWEEIIPYKSKKHFVFRVKGHPEKVIKIFNVKIGNYQELWQREYNNYDILANIAINLPSRLAVGEYYMVYENIYGLTLLEELSLSHLLKWLREIIALLLALDQQHIKLLDCQPSHFIIEKEKIFLIDFEEIQTEVQAPDNFLSFFGILCCHQNWIFSPSRSSIKNTLKGIYSQFKLQNGEKDLEINIVVEKLMNIINTIARRRDLSLTAKNIHEIIEFLKEVMSQAPIS